MENVKEHQIQIVMLLVFLRLVQMVQALKLQMMHVKKFKKVVKQQVLDVLID